MALVTLRGGPSGPPDAHEGFPGCERIVAPTYGRQPQVVDGRPTGRSIAVFAAYRRTTDADFRGRTIFDFEAIVPQHQ